MPNVTPREVLLAFSARLNRLCDAHPKIPKAIVGQRQKFIADWCGVSIAAVNKWLRAESMPGPDNMNKLAALFGIDASELQFGVPKRNEKMAHSTPDQGAAMVVWGMIVIAGGHCGQLSEEDHRRAYVDFYAHLRGTVYPIHVSLARAASRARFEVTLPLEYSDCRSIAVVMHAPGQFHFLDLPHALINEHKSRRKGKILIELHRTQSDVYITGSDPWPRIQTFEELL